MSSKLAFVCVYVCLFFHIDFRRQFLFVIHLEKLCLLEGELVDEARRQMVIAPNAVNR